MTTPAAAPAAPAAAAPPVAPAAPAPAPTPAPAAPAAVSPPAAPAPAPAATDPPAAAPAAVAPPAPGDSILDNAADPPAAPQTDAEKLAAAKALVAKAEAAADPNGGQAWLLKDGVMGEGEKPAWFKSDKYKSVSAQAEAYVALESRFGSFVGAPKNEKGDVAYQTPPALKDILQADHPMLGDFNKWAATAQLSQAGYDQMLGMLAQYDAGFAPSGDVVRQAIGENADTRIGAVAAWAKANLDAEGMTAFRTATSLDANMHPNARVAAALKAMEKAIAKTSQIRMPKPGADVPGGQAGEGLAAIQAEYGARNPDGKLKIDTVPGYREQMQKKLNDYYAAQA